MTASKHCMYMWLLSIIVHAGAWLSCAVDMWMQNLLICNCSCLTTSSLESSISVRWIYPSDIQCHLMHTISQPLPSAYPEHISVLLTWCRVLWCKYQWWQNLRGQGGRGPGPWPSLFKSTHFGPTFTSEATKTCHFEIENSKIAHRAQFGSRQPAPSSPLWNCLFHHW